MLTGWEKERSRKVNNYIFIAYAISLLIIALAVTSYYQKNATETELLSSTLIVTYLFSFFAVVILIIWQQKMQSREDERAVSIIDLVVISGSVILVAYAVHITGSYESRFKVLYLLPPIMAAINYGRKGGLLIGTLCSAALFIDAWGSYRKSNTLSFLLDSELAYIFILMLIVWLIGSMEDIERKVRQNLLSWNKHLQQTERLSVIGQMAAGTAHEIRNPLTTIRGFLQLLQMKINNDKQEEYGEYLDIILTEIDRMNNIVSDFLVLAKPTETKLACLEINNLLQEIVSLVNSESLLKGIEFKFTYGKDLPPVAGDKEKLKQVILNFINNAFQAMEEGGRLTVGSCYNEEAKLVTVWVEDTGKGIPETILNKLFEPFFTTKETGTGLGLAISNQIIKSHNGRIRVESQLGKGTIFFIDLPRYKDYSLKE